MSFPLPSLLAVLLGGAIGSALRWALGLALNPVLASLPLGTLAVNLIGGFIIGGAMGVFDHYQTLPPELRLFVITGFCGGLTTFSTFSAETVALLLRAQYAWAFAIVATHVIGSLATTLAGLGLVRLLVRA
ncbi:MAG: fluoride efflux transporter CrcB [Proteobacteria bacterium]|nr:fluoride efflux transporter CrcB [Pseudomonadota bacterium]